MKSNAPIILALDFPDIQSTQEMIEKTSHVISIYKLGLEFYLAQGKNGIAQINRSFPDIDIFLDLKLHDIPNTVAGACSSVAELKPRFLTVHASGGAEMVSAAVAASPGTSITAVTVLTSLNTDELSKLGLPHQTQTLALAMAKRAVEAGATSIVCSPQEVGLLRKELSSNIALITPGVRPKGASHDDQSRVMTPREAMDAGSNYVVIGRPITKASDPGIAAAEIASSLE
ncbi:MAG: orotidine-5'-phosphate decarboxylase [Candidatus Nanopelagicaceae bacterium]|jgi:orotidine-5'-phosphate decarboxylase|nr:orotidine-5'-phosphate decarboxylase [Candidatus Nanopelagicaceae bacterium]